MSCIYLCPRTAENQINFSSKKMKNNSFCAPDGCDLREKSLCPMDSHPECSQAVGQRPPPATCSNLGSPMTPGVLHDACEPSGSRRNLNLWSVIWMLVTLPYTESEKRSSSLHRVILSCPDPTWLAQIPHPPSWPDNTCAMHFPGDSEATQHTREKIMYFIRITLFFP